MAGITDNGAKLWNGLRILVWGGAATLFVLPLIAMQFTSEVKWTAFDFAVFGVMMGIACGAFELATRLIGDIAHRAGVLGAVATAILLFWVNGAVGFLGDEGNPANLMFFGVIAIAVVGSVFTGFKAGGMALSMFAAAAAQVLVGVVALAFGWTSPGYAGLYEVVMGTSVFCMLWLVSGGLLRIAAKEGRPAAS